MEQRQPTFTIPSQLGKHATQFHEMPIQVGKPIKGGRIRHVLGMNVLGMHIFRNLKEKKKSWQPGPNLDVLCMRQQDVAAFCENF